MSRSGGSPADATEWSQTPRPADAEGGSDRGIAGALALVVVGSAPLSRLAAETRPVSVAVVAVVAVAVLVLALAHRRRRAWWVALAVGVLTSAASASRTVAVALGLGAWARHRSAVAADGSTGPREEVARLGLPTALNLVAAATARVGDRPSLMVLAQLAAVALTAPPPSVLAAVRVVDRTAVRAASRVAGVLGVVLGMVLAAVVVPVPWVLERMVGWDPLWTPRPGGTRLVPRHLPDTDRRRMWIPPTSFLPIGAGRRARATGLVLVTLLVAGAAALGATADRLTGTTDAAMVGSPWWPEARRAQLLAFDEAALTGFLGPVLADVRSPTTNVADGRRATWAPPGRAAVQIWMFGGSAAFGLGQRDDHTVASELARLADRDGRAVAVTNFGVHGDVLWMEQRRLRAALAEGDDPPDLVIFYDGFNDLATTLAVGGSTAGTPFVGSVDSGTADGTGFARWLRNWIPRNVGPAVVVPRPTRHLDDDELLDRAVAQYRMALEDVRADLADAGIEGRFFLQPNRTTRRSPVPGEGTDDDRFRSLWSEFARRRPDEVIDLSDAFDAEDRPVYWDGVHTNEHGADIVAQRIYEAVRPLLPTPAAPR